MINWKNEENTTTNKQRRQIVDEKIIINRGHLEQKFAQRLQTVPLREKGKGTGEIAEFLGIKRATVSVYINRYNIYTV